MIALLTVAASFALDGEVALETGTLDLGGRALHDVTGPGGFSTGGLRLAIAATDHLSVVGSLHTGSRGAFVTIAGVDRLTAAFRGQELTLGAQFDVDATEVVAPYLLVEALALPATMLFDSDPGHDDNPAQDKRSAFTGGGAALLGCDVHARQGGSAFAPAAFVEVGYAYAAPLDFGDYGKVPVHGALARVGAGLRF